MKFKVGDKVQMSENALRAVGIGVVVGVRENAVRVRRGATNYAVWWRIEDWEHCPAPQMKIKSTTNGIWFHVGESRVCLSTIETATLIEHLQEALQHCGEWEVNEMKELKRESEN